MVRVGSNVTGEALLLRPLARIEDAVVVAPARLAVGSSRVLVVAISGSCSVLGLLLVSVFLCVVLLSLELVSNQLIHSLLAAVAGFPWWSVPLRRFAVETHRQAKARG